MRDRGSCSGSALTVVTSLLVVCLSTQWPALAWTSGSPCSSLEARLQRTYPAVRFYPVFTGLHLEFGDAILVCREAQVVLKANLPISNRLSWVRDVDSYVANLDADTMIALRWPVPPNASAEVVQMSGMALYSRDRDIVGCCDFPSNMTVIANEERLKDRLAKLRGQLVSVGEEIDAWGLVWTGPTGRVEIEIVTPGPQYRFDRDTDVLDAHGGFTNRKRFLENSFFVMNPTYFEGGRITKAIGEVFVLRDPDGVKSFLPTVSAVWGSDAWSGEILRRWREALEQTELE